ncbi:hypothetical protein [uncultured Chitinophaga sp.]|uniref:hypothetical protein n=1 Tax=uncultured Chitinophaga sp. TaxID=339340 RepID=UPI0025D1F942|nr:hypothetical protein [uncultured Chitinophaga sp.]
MRKLSVKKLVDFRRKSARGKKTFVENIKSTKIETPTEGGGDYWISSISAIANSFKEDDLRFIDSKIEDLYGRIGDTSRSITKNMYRKNVTILEQYKKIDQKTLRPGVKLSFLKQTGIDSVLAVKGIEVQVKPTHVYTFKTKTEQNAGAVWFLAKIGGYRIEEVGMFCEMLHRFLIHNYSKSYKIDARYCIVVEALTGNWVSYANLIDGSVPRVLNSTLSEISKMM